MAFDSVPTCTSTRPCTRKWSMVPRPLRPNTPEECASSTIMMAPYFSASSHRAGSGPMSPSIENTPSVISSFLPGSFLISFSSSSAWAVSLWRKTLIFARDSLDVFEAPALPPQLQGQRHGAGDGAPRARAHAELLRGFQRRLAQLGMRRQPQVVVRRQVDDPFAVERTHRRLLVLEHAQLEVGAALLQVVELVGEVSKRVGASSSRHESLRREPDILTQPEQALCGMRYGAPEWDGRVRTPAERPGAFLTY